MKNPTLSLKIFRELTGSPEATEEDLQEAYRVFLLEKLKEGLQQK